MKILALNKDTKNDLLESLLKRSPNNYGEFEGRVNDIVTKVREERDAAVFAYTKQFDGADISADNVLVTDAEIEEAEPEAVEEKKSHVWSRSKDESEDDEEVAEEGSDEEVVEEKKSRFWFRGKDDDEEESDDSNEW